MDNIMYFVSVYWREIVACLAILGAANGVRLSLDHCKGRRGGIRVL